MMKKRTMMMMMVCVFASLYNKTSQHNCCEPVQNELATSGDVLGELLGTCNLHVNVVCFVVVP